MVQRILTNEGYTGRAYWGKRKGMSKTRRQVRPREEWMAFPVLAMLDEATFHAAQQQLQRNRMLSPRHRKYEYLLIGGRFRCGRCGRAMTGFPMKGVRYYRCNGRTTLMDPAQWCHGHIKAAIAEERVWATVERLLQDPDLIVAEVARQQAGADERHAALAQELSLVDTGLTKCDREEQRWAEAYAGEGINPQELKRYRNEIAMRRESLQAQQTSLLAELNAIGQAAGRVEALIEYRAQIHQRLHAFDTTEKRIALEALDLRVTWIPEQPEDPPPSRLTR
jgi:site-specific DNA recombinase